MCNHSSVRKGIPTHIALTWMGIRPFSFTYHLASVRGMCNRHGEPTATRCNGGLLTTPSEREVALHASPASSAHPSQPSTTVGSQIVTYSNMIICEYINLTASSIPPPFITLWVNRGGGC